MDELKKRIEENRALFDSAEPSDKHFDKFKEMLFQNKTVSDNHKLKSLTFRQMLKVAAVTILIVLSGLYVSDQFLNRTQKHVGNQNSEFTEAQKYYIQLVDHKMSEIKGLQSTLHDEQNKMLLNEITEMDELYKKLQEDYHAMPNDPRIVQALLQHYQMKTEVLNRIINNLHNVQQFNTPNHENVKI